MTIFWLVVFVVSLFVLVKGVDWLIESAERLGLAVGLSPFIIGVTIVSIGTSLPELVVSLVSVWQGVTEVVAANAIGSNVANILLVVGVASIAGKQLMVSKSLIDLDLPLLAASTIIFAIVVFDGVVTFGEALLMFSAFVIYILYTILYKEVSDSLELKEVNPHLNNQSLDNNTALEKDDQSKEKSNWSGWDFVFLVIGSLGIAFGSKYLVDALVELSLIFNVAVGVITIIAVALGTSLPELLVSIKAALRGNSEVALGNIFGSNVFNILMVVGIPGLFNTLILDEQTLTIGLPVMVLATFLFVISGISRRIHAWEGAFYLVLYLLFIAKLFEWF
ncbi:MAG: calcium/sodium antiporter [Patescibacteria group bacterium]